MSLILNIYSKDKWGFIAKEPGGESGNGNLVRGKTSGELLLN